MFRHRRITPITNAENIIDSREVIARIDYLEGIDEAGVELTDEDGAELTALRALLDGTDAMLCEWRFGVTLIRETHFTEYAEEYAEDICNDPSGLITTWPYRYIDWAAAAGELRNDFTAIDFDGVTYYARG